MIYELFQRLDSSFYLWAVGRKIGENQTAMAEQPLPPASIENIENLIQVELRNFRGIYFLCYGGKVVYVGQSNNVYTRIGTHINENIKVFDSAFVRMVSSDLDIDIIEQHFIQKLQPYYNYQGKRIHQLKSTPDEIAEALISMQHRIELKHRPWQNPVTDQLRTT